MSGTTILDNKRPSTLRIQPDLNAFTVAFDAITGGLLSGLDWTNVFVAGGIALGALLCTDVARNVPKYVNSDIDLYIYGLGPLEANEKVEHVYRTWLSNLPSNAPHQVLRNSRTITCVDSLAIVTRKLFTRRTNISLLSSYPIKRIQIVLKLVKNPKDVLLNFDLDPCAMGFDGAELWILPRAARAIQS